jgi:hypothetical protein
VKKPQSLKWQDKFNLDKAGHTNETDQRILDYHTKVLHGLEEEKGMFGRVYLMTPDDFLVKSGLFERLPDEKVETDKQVIDKLKYMYEDKNYKWNLPYHDMNFEHSKGLHRVYICKKNGMGT